MENVQNLEGKIAYLPDGQEVVIEFVEDSVATVRRIDGPFKGKIAVCNIRSLEMEAASH